jgi:alcohol dehydrogenase class IV
MALKKRQPESQVLLRYGEIAKILTQNELATLDDGIQWIADLCSDLQIPNFSKYGITDRDLPEIIQKAAVASSMQANPILLTPEEMLEILEKTL